MLIPCLLFVISCAKDASEDDSSVYVSQPFNNSNTESPSTSVTQFTLTVSAGEGGSVSTVGGTFNDGTSGTSSNYGGSTTYHDFNSGLSGSSSNYGGNTTYHNFNDGSSGTSSTYGNTTYSIWD